MHKNMEDVASELEYYYYTRACWQYAVPQKEFKLGVL